jgi:hypothetical protein
MILYSCQLIIQQIAANTTPSSVAGNFLQKHWHETLLNTVETTLEWLKSITGKELHAVALKTVYNKVQECA